MKVVVRAKDSLSYYSRLFTIPIELIIDSNPGLIVKSLQVGQEIQIPGFTLQKYTVKSGDSFNKLAKRLNVPVDALFLLNQGINQRMLMFSQKIQIPIRVTEREVQISEKYDYRQLQQDIDTLKQSFPFIHINNIGKSVDGKLIQEIRLGKGSKKIHMNASFHANEWITTPVLMSFLNTFLLSLTNNELIRGRSMMTLYQSVDISIVPMVNPDGVDLVLYGPASDKSEELIRINNGSSDFSSWKANIRGVDLNNQFPAKWEIEKDRKEPKLPAPRDFPGDASLTEPEAIAMVSLVRDNQFDRLIAYHTQGEEFYWGYEDMEPYEARIIAEEFEKESGYVAVQFIDSHAGYKDWFIQEYRKPGFTIELGLGVNPLPISQFDEIYNKALGIFLASLYM